MSATDGVAWAGKSQWIAAVLDTETTGLSSEKDRVIEIGIQLFRFGVPDADGVEMLESYTALEDPGFPISFEIQRVTGITPSMLTGQKIDWSRVDELLARADIVLAHNAAFDRGFLDRVSRVSPEKIWGCTSAQINWRGKGFKNARLQDLCGALGIEFQAHRAMNDVNATVKLVCSEDVFTGKPYLAELLQGCTEELAWIWVEGETFDRKDAIKTAGFKWNGNTKVWGKFVPLRDEAMSLDLYRSLLPGLSVQSRVVPPTERFKGGR